MTILSPNLGLKLYDLPTDDSVIFESYVEDVTGVASTSNMMKIDTEYQNTLNALNALKGVGYINETVKGNSDLIASLKQKGFYICTTTGTDSLVGTITDLTTTIPNGTKFILLPNAKNTTTVNLVLNTTASLPITKVRNVTGSTVYAPLEDGDLQPNMPVVVVKSTDGARYLLVDKGEEYCRNIFFKKDDGSFVDLQTMLQPLTTHVEITTQLPITSTTTITRTSTEPQSVEVNMTPTHIINLLGASGNCESTTPFTAVSGCTLSLDTSKKVYGANALKITLAATTGTVSIPVGTTFDPTLYYLFSAFLDKGNATNITLQKDATGGGVLRSVTSTSVTPTRGGFVTAPADNNAGNLIKIVVTGSIGQIAYIDGIMDNVITLTDYSALIATTLAKYPYVDSIGTTINPSVKITHADGSIAQAVVEGEFMTGDLVNIVDNQVTGSKLWKKRVLFGKDYDWIASGDGVGYKWVGSVGLAVNTQLISNKFDGAILKFGDVTLIGDIVGFGGGITYISAFDTATGFTESEVMNNDLWKAYLNGWKKTGASSWVSVVDGTTAPTVQSIDFVKANLAPNYEGYKLYYKLATPQPINESSDSYLAPLVGDALMLENGANSVVFDTGVVLGEVATFVNVGGFYQENENSSPSTFRKYKAQNMINLYKNGVVDPNAIIFGTVGVGDSRYALAIANYDQSATYTVDYTILKTQSPHISTAQLKYSDGIVSAIEGLYGVVDTKQNSDISLETYVDLSMYEKTLPNKKCITSWDFNTPKLSVTFAIPVVKKLSPTPFITQDTLIISKGNGAVNVTNLFTLESRVYSDEQVTITYSTTDATTITDIKANGVIVTASVTVDCKGRL